MFIDYDLITLGNAFCKNPNIIYHRTNSIQIAFYFSEFKFQWHANTWVEKTFIFA